MKKRKLFFEWLFKGLFLKSSLKKYQQENEEKEIIESEDKKEPEECDVHWV